MANLWLSFMAFKVKHFAYIGAVLNLTFLQAQLKSTFVFGMLMESKERRIS